jgi:subtilisin family serine protease
MYLLTTSGISSFENAYDYCISEGIQIVSASIGWDFDSFYGGCDGTSPPSVIVDNATFSGVLSVVAAGNEGPGAHTLGSPSDARLALTVGAMAAANWSSGPIDSYSSRGPVKATAFLPEAIKPEIVGPSYVDTKSYGNSAFNGTSSATPHIAAAAALLLCLFPGLTPFELKAKVISFAKPVQTSPDNTYGYGKLVLDDNLVTAINTGGLIAYPVPSSLSKKGYVKITNIPQYAGEFSVNIFTVSGEFVQTLDYMDSKIELINGLDRRSVIWDMKNKAGNKVAPGVYIAVVETALHGKLDKKHAVQK